MADNRFEGLIKALCALASERGNLNDRVDAAISRLPITPPTQMRNATMSVSALHSGPGRRWPKSDSQTM
jgi:hypothetical protein